LPEETDINNDIDAFRHAYASGVFTQEFSEEIANILGQFNEIKGDLNDQPEDQRNMDLWNNKIGREYGKKATSKEELAELLKKALENEELIITNDQTKDSRKYEEDESTKNITIDPNKPVQVIQESNTGRNLIFINMLSGAIMDNNEFVAKINDGKYPGYQVKMINELPIPVSIADGDKGNNLG